MGKVCIKKLLNNRLSKKYFKKSGFSSFDTAEYVTEHENEANLGTISELL